VGFYTPKPDNVAGGADTVAGGVGFYTTKVSFYTSGEGIYTDKVGFCTPKPDNVAGGADIMAVREGFYTNKASFYTSKPDRVKQEEDLCPFPIIINGHQTARILPKMAKDFYRPSNFVYKSTPCILSTNIFEPKEPSISQ